MTDDVWTVKRILAWIEDYLAQHGDDKPLASAQWLVAESLGISRMQLYLDPARPLTSEERAVLRDYTRRRASGEPLQYITGTTDFRYITLKVAPGVLIPRPETETLVSEALALLPAAPRPRALEDDEIAALLEGGDEAAEDAAKPQQLLTADIGTGTGCIACSLAKEHPQVRVIATDIAPEAVALASENVEALGLTDRVSIVSCDVGEGVDDELLGAFDLVVSNPPYVPTAVLDDIPREVADFEPSLALDGGSDGLDVFRRLLDWAKVALRPGGALAVELFEDCLEDAAAEAEYAGFADVRIVCDLAGRPRVLTARKR